MIVRVLIYRGDASVLDYAMFRARHEGHHLLSDGSTLSVITLHHGWFRRLRQIVGALFDRPDHRTLQVAQRLLRGEGPIGPVGSGQGTFQAQASANNNPTQFVGGGGGVPIAGSLQSLQPNRKTP